MPILSLFSPGETGGPVAFLPVLLTILALSLIIALRSAIIVGVAFLWLRFAGFAQRRRIFRLPYAAGQLASELRAALPVIVLDAAAITAVGVLGLLPVASPTLFNTLAGFVLMFVWFEVWFYAAHRLMHQPRFYWIHRQHHVAKVVDPLSSLSFSLVERAILLVGALGFAIAITHLMPISAAGLSAYALVNYLLNVVGHSNVEIFPAWFVESRLGRYIVTPTFHALHHARYRGHYGLFTSVLDRAFNSVFPDYSAVQQRASEGAGLSRQGERLEAPPAPAPMPASGPAERGGGLGATP